MSKYTTGELAKLCSVTVTKNEKDGGHELCMR